MFYVRCPYLKNHPPQPKTLSAETFYKNNPGLQGAVNKTSELLLPTLEAGTLQYALLLNSTHSTIKVGTD